MAGAVDRLRNPSTTGRPVVIAAADPANPYGTALPWPHHPGRLSRTAGAYVVLIDGHLAAFVDRGGRTVLSFVGDPDLVRTTAGAVRDLAERRMKRMVVGAIDGADPAETPLGRALLDSGFVVSYRGLAAKGG